MKVVALIPIKMNNERVPGKNIKLLGDRTPLVHLIQKSLLNVKNIDEIYLYCSNSKIKQYILPGVKYLKRDEKYDTAQADVNDMFYAFSKAVPADVYVLAHATAPFLKSESIYDAVEAVRGTRYDSAIAVRKMQEFLWKEGHAINYDSRMIPRTQDLEPLYVETTGLYIFTRQVIQNIRSRIGNNPYLKVVSPIEAIDINNPEDFEIADAVYRYIIKSM